MFVNGLRKIVVTDQSSKSDIFFWETKIDVKNKTKNETIE